MNNEEDKTILKNERRMKWMLIAACITTALTVFVFILMSLMKDLANLEMNEIGDAVAGFASFLAFLWLIVTVVLQYSELRLQRQEITELRAASEDQANSLRMTNRVHTLALIRSRQEDISPSLVERKNINSKIVVNFLKKYLGIRHAEEFYAQPDKGFPYIFEYFTKQEELRECAELLAAINSSTVRSDFAYDAFIAVDSLVHNMEDIWGMLKPVWQLAQTADAKDEFRAWEIQLGVKWYATYYPATKALLVALRKGVADGNSGNDLNRLVARMIIEDEEEEPAGVFQYYP